MKKYMLMTLFAFAQLSYAQSVQNEIPVQLKNNNSFNANLYITDNINTFNEQFKSKKLSEFKNIETLKQNKTFTSLIQFSGCKQINSECYVNVDFSVKFPDGQTVPLPTQTLWKGKPKANGEDMLGQAKLKNRVEKFEPVGEYQINAVITDENSGQVIRLSESLDVLSDQ